MLSSQDASSASAIAATRRGSRGFLRAKLLVASLILLALLVVFGTSLLREATMVGRTAGGAAARPSLAPPRPALTPAEEAYAQALWAIHGDVKHAAYNMTFSGLR